PARIIGGEVFGRSDLAAVEAGAAGGAERDLVAVLLAAGAREVAQQRRRVGRVAAGLELAVTGRALAAHEALRVGRQREARDLRAQAARPRRATASTSEISAKISKR